jgi:nucleotide-binding universal stress UspA family protein
MTPFGPDPSGPHVHGSSVIVVGLDGSDTSMRAAAFAVGLARRQASRLVFVYVQNTSAGAMTPQVIPALITVGEDIADDLHALLAQRLEDWPGQWELRRLVGNPFAELTRIAAEVHADLVIVGASARLGHRLVGSLAVHLVKARRWPVTVVP